MVKTNYISKHKLNDYCQGVALVEVMVALLILMLAIIPLISAFSKFYGVSSKQLDQEIALKITEAAMNKLLSAKFSSLNKGLDTIEFPLNIQTPAGTFSGDFSFSGDSGGSNKIILGPNSYELKASTVRVFEAQNPLAKVVNPKSLPFRFIEDTDKGPVLRTYYCTDDMIAIQMSVEYGKNNKQLAMVTFRADMAK